VISVWLIHWAVCCAAFYNSYVPLEQFEQAPSLTLAYAFDDWATSQLAGVVGKTAEQAMLLNRSMNFKCVGGGLGVFAWC